MKKLIIIDEYFTGKSGHPYEYNKSVKEIFEAKGIAVTIYANERLDPVVRDELQAVPCFKGLPKNALNKIPLAGQVINRILFSVSLYKRLKKIYRSADNDTTFFFTTVVWYNVLPVALAACSSKVVNALLYRYSVKEHIGLSHSLYKLGDYLFRYTFNRLLQYKRDSTLFFTDSEVIAEECNDLFSCNMKVLPIPHIDDKGLPQSVKTDTYPPFRLYLPGPARAEKGIAFIIDTLEYLERNEDPLLRDITLIIQQDSAALAKAGNGIRERLDKINVQCDILGSLSTEAYEEQIARAHIILIPYEVAQGYRARTSGIMSETIAACKPFITTAGSWMSIQAGNYHTGLIITYNEPREFAAAIASMVRNYPSFKAQAQKARSSWLSFHSKASFYNIFEEQYRKITGD